MPETIKLVNPYKRKRTNEGVGIFPLHQSNLPGIPAPAKENQNIMLRVSTNPSSSKDCPNQIHFSSQRMNEEVTVGVSLLSNKLKSSLSSIARDNSFSVPCSTHEGLFTTCSSRSSLAIQGEFKTSSSPIKPRTTDTPESCSNITVQSPSNNNAPQNLSPFLLQKKKAQPHYLCGGSEKTDIGATHLNPSNVSSSASALVIAAANKAGMDGIDREMIDRIILEESGDSLFMQQQRRRDEKVNQKIYQLQIKLQQQQKQDPSWIQSYERVIDQDEIPTLISARPLRSCKVVVDMDMFYMACELLSRPDLAAVNDSQPACVGGDSMISTSNYAARKYGVRAAMPGYIGRKLVERISKGQQTLVFCKPNYDLYKEKSLQVMTVLQEYDPFHMKSYSLDEAYIDLGQYLACKLTMMKRNQNCEHEHIRKELLNEQAQAKQKQNIKNSNTCLHQCEESSQHVVNPLKWDTDWSDSGTIEAILLSHSPAFCLEVASSILNEMRHHVHRISGLTCSAGLGANFLIAKIASDCNKPNGQKVVGSSHEDITNFLYPLPIRKVCGVGRVTEKVLKSFGINTLCDLYEQRALVRFLFQTSGTKDSQAAFLLKASVGCSSSDGQDPDVDEAASEDTHQKGISRERSFQPGKSWSEINSKLEDIGHGLSKDMERKNLWARTITLKVKLHTFDCLSRSRTMPEGVFLQSPASDLIRVAVDLLNELKKEYITSQTAKKNSSGSVQFSVRLLGIRCHNFQGDKDNCLESSKQLNIDRFFQRTRDGTVDQTAATSFVGSSTKTSPVPLITIKNCFPSALKTDERNIDLALSDAINLNTTTKVSVAPLADDPAVFDSTLMVPASSDARSNFLPKQCSSESKMTVDHIYHNSTSQVVTCPVCGLNINVAADQNFAINQHIDSCLSGAAIRRAVREDSGNHAKEGRMDKKRRSLIDFFSGQM